MRFAQTVEQVARELRDSLPPDWPKAIPSLYIMRNANLRNTLGRFRWTSKVAWVELNPKLDVDPNELRVTFLHELAHAWCYFAGYPGAKHNDLWKYYASRLGIVPKATYRYSELSPELRTEVMRRKCHKK